MDDIGYIKSVKNIIAIDATNIKLGGGLTHLVNLIKNLDPVQDNFFQIIVWCSPEIYHRLPQKEWLIKVNSWWCELPIVRFLAVQLILPFEIKKLGCDVLFSPGGTLPFFFLDIPKVTMSQNMLPFEDLESSLFGRFSLMYFKLKLLGVYQSLSFRKADGLIFLTYYAKKIIEKKIDFQEKKVSVIPHGIEDRFFINFDFSPNKSEAFNLLYVSIFLPYKHQIEVVQALHELNLSGYNFSLSLVGANDSKYGLKTMDYIRSVDPLGKFIYVKGPLPFEHIQKVYKSSNAFIFASSCENLPNILIEAMATGIPMICSNRGPMPEVLGDFKGYFDPYSVESIKESIVRLYEEGLDDNQGSIDMKKNAKKYSWRHCAQQTLRLCLSVIDSEA